MAPDSPIPQSAYDFGQSFQPKLPMKIIVGSPLVFSLLLSLATGSALRAQITLNASDAGRYSQNGDSTAVNTNYFAGYNSVNGLTYHNFFAFDLSAISGGITNASITIAQPASGFTSNISPLTYSLFDVLTSAGTV